MCKRVLSFLAAVILSAFASPLWAGQPTGAEAAEDHARLEKKAARVEERLRGRTGALEREQLRHQRREIDELIRRIERGEGVSPAEVDEALETVPVRRRPTGAQNR
jgi:hypothetical protein